MSTEPKYFRHKNRPAWGTGQLVESNGDTRTYVFTDGSRRSLKAALCDELMEPAAAPEEADQVRLSRGAGGATPKALSLELEAEIRKHPDDPAGYLVYADWLQAKNDPRGLLVPLQHQLSQDPDNRKLKDAEKELFATNGEYFVPEGLRAVLRPAKRKEDDPERCEAQWKFGFLSHVRLSKRARQDGTLDALVTEVLGHPSAAFLRGLTIGPLGTPNSYNYSRVIAAIAKASPSVLADLFIGDFPNDTMDLAFTRSGELSLLLGALPALERLTVRAGEIALRGALSHPTLKTLRMVLASLTVKIRDAGIYLAELPMLETLELECPALQHDGKRLIALLERLPRLRRLVLSSALLPPLLTWPGLARLESVELSGDVPEGFILPSLPAHVKVTARPRAQLTEADVVARAPDARSMTAARGIANPGDWDSLGQDGPRIWGEYEGSDHYYVMVRTDSQDTSCGCASTKDPCKHALALLILAARGHAFEERPVPERLLRQTRERPRYQSSWE
jgi:uncharacterized protein (TIGR02996 family)